MYRGFGETFWLFYDNYVANELLFSSVTSLYVDLPAWLFGFIRNEPFNDYLNEMGF